MNSDRTMMRLQHTGLVSVDKQIVCIYNTKCDSSLDSDTGLRTANCGSSRISHSNGSRDERVLMRIDSAKQWSARKVDRLNLILARVSSSRESPDQVAGGPDAFDPSYYTGPANLPSSCMAFQKVSARTLRMMS